MALDHGSGDPQGAARRAAKRIAELSGVVRHDVAIVLGTGWARTADTVGEHVAAFPATRIPGFRASTVPGHTGELASRRLRDGRHVLVIGARSHLYEGHGVSSVAHGVRTAAAVGAGIVVLTNGAGGLNPDYTPGQVVLIADQINLTGASPLDGSTFINMRGAYSPDLRSLARSLDDSLAEGIYAQFRGPQYETPAEVRMARTLGADLVGMSTALETIAARAAGLDVLGLSLVTNVVTDSDDDALSHESVLAAGDVAHEHLSRLLSAIVDATG